MVKYKSHKQGLVIGSDNVFFYRDSQGILQDHFRAIVKTIGFQPNEPHLVNEHIQTASEQLIWDELHNPRPGVVQWLNEHAPGWGARTNPDKRDRQIFFAQRDQALAFVQMVIKHAETRKIVR